MLEKQGSEDKPQQTNIMIGVPKYTRSVDRDSKNIVLYDLRFSELQTGYEFEMPYRFSELKKFHESLETLKQKLPKFPGTNWFFRSNDDDKKIEERRAELDYYFQNVLSIRDVRESYLMKNFIQDAQLQRDKKQHKNVAHLKDQKEDVNHEVKIKRKKHGSSNVMKQFQTPAIMAQKAPEEDRERANSFEDKAAPERKLSRKLSEKKFVTFGGRGVMRGILHNTKK